MPRGKKPETKPKQFDFQFVKCDLPVETKEMVKKWDEDYTLTIDNLERMIEDGYKISISRDKYNDCIGAFATHPDQQSPNNGFCLSARGPSMLNALKVLVYKHFNILQEKWYTEVDQAYERDSWG